MRGMEHWSPLSKATIITVEGVPDRSKKSAWPDCIEPRDYALLDSRMGERNRPSGKGQGTMDSLWSRCYARLKKFKEDADPVAFAVGVLTALITSACWATDVLIDHRGRRFTLILGVLLTAFCLGAAVLVLFVMCVARKGGDPQKDGQEDEEN